MDPEKSRRSVGINGAGITLRFLPRIICPYGEMDITLVFGTKVGGSNPSGGIGKLLRGGRRFPGSNPGEGR